MGHFARTTKKYNTMATVTHSITTVARSKWTFSRHHGKSSGRTQTGSCTRSSSAGNSGTKAQRARTLHLVGGRIICRKVSCDAIGIYYATTTGNTEAAAEWVKDLMPGDTTDIQEIGEAIEEIHDVFSSAGAKMIGYVPTEEYQFEASKAVRDGKFLGLPLDANNEDDLTGVRHCLQMDTQTGRIWTRTSTSSDDHQIVASSACARALNEAGAPIGLALLIFTFMNTLDDELTEERVKAWTARLIAEGMNAR